MANPKKDPADTKPASAEPEQVSSATPPAAAKPEAKSALVDLAPAKAAAEAPKAAPAAPAPAPAPAAPAKPTSATYKVWTHGTLQRNGKTYQPGDTLTLDPAEAEKIPCLELVAS